MTRRAPNLLSPLRRWMKAARVTFPELAERCLKFGWKTSGNHLQQVAAGTRGISWDKAETLSKASGYAVSPQEIASFRTLKMRQQLVVAAERSA